MKFLVVLAACCLVSCQAWLFGSGPEWNGLRVTWGVNPFSSNVFARMPRTVSEAETAGWKLDTACSDKNYFRGNRYIKYESSINADDTAVMLLFDKNGFIAGIQCGIPDNLPSGYPKPNIQPPMHHESARNMYTITGYFVDPATICSQGRTQQEFDEQGTGTALHIQHGAVDQLMTIPLLEADVGTTKWVKGECFWTMGHHYWYNITLDMNCDDIFPMFLLYNNGKLNAFGWALLPEALDSPRFEHPGPEVFDKFLKEPPTCLYAPSVGKLSVIHIFLDDSPRNNFC